MKFFTMAWWIGVQHLEFYDPNPDYQRHLATIRDMLPEDLLNIQESISLHDSCIRDILHDARSGSLVIQLDGDDGKGGLRQLWLIYENVVSFRSIADPEIGIGGPHGYGDLGYDEVDVTTDGQIEHRILFSTGIEFQIVFKGFRLKWQDMNM